MTQSKIYSELSQLKLTELECGLAAAGVPATSASAHHAIRTVKEGGHVSEALRVAISRETTLRNQWIETTLDPWCKRHNLTRRQALSVLFEDDSYNPADPRKDLVTMKDIFAWNGQQNGFYAYLKREEEKAAPSNPRLKGVDVFSPNLSEEQKCEILEECKTNSAYFFQILSQKK